MNQANAMQGEPAIAPGHLKVIYIMLVMSTDIFQSLKPSCKPCTKKNQVPHTSELSVANQVNAMQEAADHKQKHDVATDHSEVT